MSYVDEAFNRLKSNLEITPTENQQAQTRHQLVRNHIEASWDLANHFLTGSYKRHTATKKLKDVDIFVVVDPNGSQGYLANGTGTAAVLALRNLLAYRWDDLEADDNVVTIHYRGEDVASYEIAPVFPRKGGGYLMPDGVRWIATDPKEQAALVTAKNKRCDEKFVPFVKMVKGINREAGDPIEPAFLLETMALKLVLTPFGRYQDEIRFFLASVADQIAENWPDPVGIGPDVNEGVDGWRRRELSASARSWLGVAEEALRLEEEHKERAAVEEWRKLFGWRMPRP